MSYQSIPEPRPRVHSSTLAQELEDIFYVDRYKFTDPVFVIDFASDYVRFLAFTKGENLEQFNDDLRENNDIKMRQSKSRHVINPCVAMCNDRIVIALLKADYYYELHTQHFMNCSEVKVIKTYHSTKAPTWINKVLCNRQFSSFRVGLISTSKEKEYIYAVCHNLFFIDDRLYLSANVNQNHYSALAVANYLTVVTNFLKNVGCTGYSTVYTKIDIHSPGNILLYVDRAVNFCSENWMGLLLLFTILFGGKIQTDKFYVELPSFRNFVEYFVNWEYDKKMKKELLNQAVAKTRAMELDNEIKAYDLEMRKKQMLNKAKELEEVSKQLNITTTNGNSTEPQTVLEVLDQHTA